MSAHLGLRFLRPRFVFFVSGYVWVVDERQPVAALIDPHSVGIDGLDRSEYAEGRRLICAGRADAWCMTNARRRNDIAPSPDISPQTLRRKPALLVTNPGGGMCRVEVV